MLKIKSEKGAFNFDEIVKISSKNRFKEIHIDVEKITLDFKYVSSHYKDGMPSIFEMLPPSIPYGNKKHIEQNN